MQNEIYAECHLCWVLQKGSLFLSMVSVIMLSVIMLNGVAPKTSPFKLLTNFLRSFKRFLPEFERKLFSFFVRAGNQTRNLLVYFLLPEFRFRFRLGWFSLINNSIIIYNLITHADWMNEWGTIALPGGTLRVHSHFLLVCACNDLSPSFFHFLSLSLSLFLFLSFSLWPLNRVCTPSSLVRERERDKERNRERERSGER
jgi:hypothetical protein